jgi:hypothetical protein
MKKIIITIAAIALFASPALAIENCNTELPDMIEKLKETTKISPSAKEKFIPHLEEALKLCKAGDLEKADEKVRKMHNEFFRDALYNQQTFYGN